jgi:adenosylcobinamide-GDP ribazoletransferase
MNSFFIMTLFFTRIKAPYNVEYNEEEFAKGIKMLPLVGAVVGGILYIVLYLLDFIGFENQMATIIAWIIYVVLTGGIHIDGLADTFDGIYSNRERERMLEIMKDSQIGTFGVLGIISVLAIGVVGSSFLDKTVFFVFPIISRSIALLICYLNSYARKDGMGKLFIERCTKREAAVGIVTAAIIAVFFFGIAGIVSLALSIVFISFSVNRIAEKLGGITGDVIGFSIEVVQVVFILALYSFTVTQK